jgi:UDP-N-acetylmuramate dehydrogenase
MLFEEKVQENVLLKPYTTLGIGGLARYFVVATDEEIIYKAVAWAKKQDLPLFVLGGGSNLIIADKGFPGLVLHINNQGIEHSFLDDKVLVSVAAGEVWDNFVALSVEHNWGGIECMSGIPGKVGATPIQNVGAYGQEVKTSIVKVKVYDRLLEKFVSFSNQECEFSYRQSIFKSTAKDRYIVIDVTFALTPNALPEVNYTELQKYLTEKGYLKPTLADVRKAVIAIRQKKAMIVDAQDPDSRSAGSFFMNPIVDLEVFQQLQAEFLKDHPRDTIPQFAAQPGKIKLSAAWLIEKSGLKKSYQKGGAAISSKHSLAITNRDNATSKDICDLAKEIQEKVKAQFNIHLDPEPIFVGFEPFECSKAFTG